MGLRDMIKKKEKLSEEYSPNHAEAVGRLATPEFKFIRSDTHTEEVIYPPAGPAGSHDDEAYLTAKDSGGGGKKERLSLDVFRSRSRGGSVSSAAKGDGGPAKKEARELKEQLRDGREGGGGTTRRLSQRLHLSRSPSTSEHVPLNLPRINLPAEDDGAADKEAAEREWENRATMLAQQNEHARSRSATPSPSGEKANPWDVSGLSHNLPPKSNAAMDDDIQEAIRLHEEGDLERSTQMFGRLADPNGANNPLGQVVYGLALRHGWGCTPDPERAVTNLSLAAANAAQVENLALQAGLKKGGALKGELVLAIFELANCFRHGWGIPKDPIAAKLYYETAAELGDTDAMNEIAWCYLEGFGCKKDKFAAAKYYRRAEKNGNKTLGNTWIWKDKYDAAKADKK